MTTTSEFSRHDTPTEMVAVLEAAGADTRDVLMLAIRHGTDWHAMVEEVCGWAFAGRHSAEGRERHAKVVAAAELLWQKMAGE